jgi:hypothetical protein
MTRPALQRSTASEVQGHGTRATDSIRLLGIRGVDELGGSSSSRLPQASNWSDFNRDSERFDL